MVQKPVKSKSPQPLPIVKPVPFPRDIRVTSFIHIFPEIFYACIACVCICVYLTYSWYVVLLHLAFSFHEYVGDYSIVVQ